MIDEYTLNSKEKPPIHFIQYYIIATVFSFLYLVKEKPSFIKWLCIQYSKIRGEIRKLSRWQIIFTG